MRLFTPYETLVKDVSFFFLLWLSRTDRDTARFEVSGATLCKVVREMKKEMKAGYKWRFLKNCKLL